MMTTDKPEIRRPATDRPQRLLIGIAALLLFGIALYLAMTTIAQRERYEDLLQRSWKALESDRISQDNHLHFITAMAPAYDMLALRAATLFLGFVVVIFGSMFVLQKVRADYDLRMAGVGDFQASLKTSSPGLVIITLGAAMVVLALFRSTSVHVTYRAVAAESDATSTTASTPNPKQTAAERELDELETANFGPAPDSPGEDAPP